MGIGAFAEECLNRVTASASQYRITRILHPSPASPAANRDWEGTATKQLIASGVWSEYKDLAAIGLDDLLARTIDGGFWWRHPHLADDANRIEQKRPASVRTKPSKYSPRLEPRCAIIPEPQQTDYSCEDSHGITNLGDAFALIRFLGYVIPFGGLIAPILIWQLKKDQFPELDQHGKMVVSFIISMLVYSAFAFVLCLVFVGIPLALALMVIVSPIRLLARSRRIMASFGSTAYPTVVEVADDLILGTILHFVSDFLVGSLLVKSLHHLGNHHGNRRRQHLQPSRVLRFDFRQ